MNASGVNEKCNIHTDFLFDLAMAKKIAQKHGKEDNQPMKLRFFMVACLAVTPFLHFNVSRAGPALRQRNHRHGRQRNHVLRLSLSRGNLLSHAF